MVERGELGCQEVCISPAWAPVLRVLGLGLQFAGLPPLITLPCYHLLDKH
jgi:hypothetical protein